MDMVERWCTVAFVNRQVALLKTCPISIHRKHSSIHFVFTLHLTLFAWLDTFTYISILAYMPIFYVPSTYFNVL